MTGNAVNQPRIPRILCAVSPHASYFVVLSVLYSINVYNCVSVLVEQIEFSLKQIILDRRLDAAGNRKE